MNKVVVTGIGITSPLGIGREKNWNAVIDGKTAVERDILDPEIFTARLKEINLPHETRLLSLAFLAFAEALHDSGLSFSDLKGNIGCTISTSKIKLSLKDDLLEDYMYSDLPTQLRRIFDVSGPCENISAACATGTDSIIVGAQWIESGKCDIVLAGSAESSFHPLYVSGFKSMGVLSKNGVKPFDKNRDGFALGEGSGILVLENKRSAVLRNAHIYGDISGFYMGDIAENAITLDEKGEAAASFIREALKRAGLEKPDYINTHGTGTKDNDIMETNAIKKALGNSAYKIPVSSTKAQTGHLLGASGAIEAAFCLLALRDGIIPPTMNLHEPGEGLDLDYVPNASRRADVRSAMSLSFGFGGQSGVLVVSK